MIETLERYIFLLEPCSFFQAGASQLGARRTLALWERARARQMIDQDNEHVKKMPRFSAMSD